MDRTLDPIVDDKKAQRARYLWMGAIIAFSGPTWGYFLNSLYILESDTFLYLFLENLMTLISILLYVIIAARYPEGLLFSDLQITKAVLLYSEYREEEIVPDQPMSDFVQYIKNLPAGLISKQAET